MFFHALHSLPHTLALAPSCTYLTSQPEAFKSWFPLCDAPRGSEDYVPLYCYFRKLAAMLSSGITKVKFVFFIASITSISAELETPVHRPRMQRRLRSCIVLSLALTSRRLCTA